MAEIVRRLRRDGQLLMTNYSLQALLSLRSEAVKLRAGIRLVQKQRELKRKSLIRYDGERLLEEALTAETSIMRFQKELSLKAALLEMERIFLVLQARFVPRFVPRCVPKL